MDILEEFDITIPLIRQLSLNVELFLWNVEYIDIGIEFRQTIEEVSFPAFYGKIWTTPGYALQIKDMFIIAYNGYITSVNGGDYSIKRHNIDGRPFYARHRRAAFYNDDPYNYITSVNINRKNTTIEINEGIRFLKRDLIQVSNIITNSNKTIISTNSTHSTIVERVECVEVADSRTGRTSRNDVLYESNGYKFYKNPPSYLEAFIYYPANKEPIVKVNYLIYVVTPMPRYSLVLYEPPTIRYQYYRAKSIQEIQDNYDMIIASAKLNK